MAEKKVWLVTGAGRGMGVDITRRPWRPGTRSWPPVANPEKVARAVGEVEDLLAVKLDVTDPADAQAASGGSTCWSTTRATSTPGSSRRSARSSFRAQVETNLFGPLNVTRAVLPVMRAQRSGVVVAISSTAGISGQEFTSAYAAWKFAVEGWIESLAPEFAPFGIRTMIVEPGRFGTELLTQESTNYAVPSIEDYAERTKQTVAAWTGMNGKQGGDPAKLGKALVQLASQDEPPLRWVAGADAVQVVEQKAKDLLGQVDAYRKLSSSLAHENAA